MIGCCDYCKRDDINFRDYCDNECIQSESQPLPSGFEPKDTVKKLLESMRAIEGKKIDLTTSECKQLADFIEYNIFDVIRNDTDIDNIGWMECMMSTYKKLRDGEKNGNT